MVAHTSERQHGEVVCHQRLGGMLNYDCLEAALI